MVEYMGVLFRNRKRALNVQRHTPPAAPTPSAPEYGAGLAYAIEAGWLELQ